MKPGSLGPDRVQLMAAASRFQEARGRRDKHEGTRRPRSRPPETTASDVAGVDLDLSPAPEALPSTPVDSLDTLASPDELLRICREMGLKIQAATDQHAAMTEELEQLVQSDPDKFSKDQIWILIRAIKVQSQILQLYLGEPALDV